MPSVNIPQRWFWGGVLALLALMGALQALSVRQESQTFDEGAHLAAGYSYWKTGDFRLNPEHPPLGKLLNAIPLLFLNPDLPLNHPAWEAADGVRFGREFLYHNRIPADTMLFAARMVTVACTLFLGVALAWWTRKRFGAPAAILAVWFFAFDPNVIAHGRYVTSDLFVTFFSFLACIFFGEYLLDARKRDRWVAGVAAGLALASKFSAVFLLPVFALLFWLRHREDPAHVKTSEAAQTAAAVLIASSLVVALTYSVPAKRRPGHAMNRVTHTQPWNPNTLHGKVLSFLNDRFRLPPWSYPAALGLVADHDTTGHPSYLFGRRSQRGWWYYFPLAFLVKAPAALLLALLAFLVLFALRRERPLPFAYWVAIIPILVYGWFTIGSRINIGIRHLLPVFPFLFALLGAGLTRWSWRGRAIAIPLLTTMLAAESLAIYPHYLAFFHFICGGPANGPKYLVDSNIDWGQDVIKLKRHLDQRGVKTFWVCYFGSAELEYYGLEALSLPPERELGDTSKFDGVIAMSVTPLQGVYVPPEDFAWLRKRTPDAKVGYSIYVYDLRKLKDSTPATK